MENTLLNYVLRIADTNLIMGHRLSEWCGHGPELEEDIALINIALDQVGQARSLYQYASEIEGLDKGENWYAYHRNEREFYNHLICELPNGDYAQTLVKTLYFDVYNYFFYKELQNSKDEFLAGFAVKSLKEVSYHHRHSGEWTIRLGDGTELSHSKMKDALEYVYPYTGELFEMDELDQAMLDKGIGVDLNKVKIQAEERIKSILDEATLSRPEGTWFQSGGKKGVHTEHLGYILAEMQYLPRTYPEAVW